MRRVKYVRHRAQALEEKPNVALRARGPKLVVTITAGFAEQLRHPHDRSGIVQTEKRIKPVGLPYINDPRFREVRLYLDNDDAGDAATRKLFENVDDRSRLADMRSYYEGYEDLNAWLLGEKS